MATSRRRSSSRAPSELQERVRFLVQTRHRGNLSAAAKDMAIPQPTLHRLIYGSATRPVRLELVQRIANHYGESLDWLITGKGPSQTESEAPPDIGSPVHARAAEDASQNPGHRAWRALLGTIGLSERSLMVWLYLPINSLARATAQFVSETIGGAALQSGGPPPDAAGEFLLERVMRPAQDHCAQAWHSLISGLIEMFGVDAIRSRMETYASSAALGFDYIGESILRGDKTLEEWGLKFAGSFPIAGDSLNAADLVLTAAELVNRVHPPVVHGAHGGRPRKTSPVKSAAPRRKTSPGR